MVLPYIKMNPPQVYMCSPSWTHLPPHTIPLGLPSAPAPSIQYRASNLDWQLVSYMVLYIFQCHSPKSSHPLPLPQSPKDCSIHQCLFCCLVYRVIVTIFLNGIYFQLGCSLLRLGGARKPRRYKWWGIGGYSDLWGRVATWPDEGAFHLHAFLNVFWWWWFFNCQWDSDSVYCQTFL